MSSEDLVRLVTEGGVAQWKPLCAELARRPPNEEATRILLEAADIPVWMLVPILSAARHRIAYDALRGFARKRHSDVAYANAAARGMVRADPVAALNELSGWLRNDPSQDIRGVAAVGLSSLGTAAAGREIALAAAAGRLGTLLAGQLLGRMEKGSEELVVELLEAAEETRWRTSAEAALARWRAAPDDEVLGRWRPHVDGLLVRQPRLDGLLRRSLTRWMSQRPAPDTA